MINRTSSLCMIVFLFALFLIPTQLVFAQKSNDGITMSVDQSEYYFMVGEDAIISLDVENNSGQQISGMLQYTITQKVQQANIQISNTNTQASSFTVNDDRNQTVSLDFGNADSPSMIIANLNFSYNDAEIGQEMNVSLGPINIHFVTDDSQKNNTPNKMQSSSQQGSSSSQSQSNQQQQSLQQRLDDMLNQPISQPQDPQQRLQNNQIAQDSNALKQEIQEQIQTENKLQQELEKHIISNEEFQELHQQLIQEGYEITQGSLNPISNSTGDFEVNYENEQGKWAKIQGNVEKGAMTDIQKQTQEERDTLLSHLREDPTFQEYEGQLTREGFIEQDIEFVYDKDETTSISIIYQDQDIRTATIQTTFVDKKLTEINLDKPGKDSLWWTYVLAILSIVIVAYLLNKKFRTEKKILKEPEIKEMLQTKPFDHVLESQNLIQNAKEDFDTKRYKDAYGKISQAVRLFLSYELNLNQEMTNENILSHLENTQYSIDEIRECFNISSLVEFARGEINKEEFEIITTLAEDLINQYTQTKE